MRTGTARIDETLIQDGRAARILCAPALLSRSSSTRWPERPPNLPGRWRPPFSAPPATPADLYAADPCRLHGDPAHCSPCAARSDAASTCRRQPGALRWPHGGGNPGRLLALLETAQTQNAEITLLTENIPPALPPSIEILPLSALPETARWADYLALDAPRTALPTLQALLHPELRAYSSGYTIEILLETPLPCGGIAECGACAVSTPRATLLACKDGPVFDWKSLF